MFEPFHKDYAQEKRQAAMKREVQRLLHKAQERDDPSMFDTIKSYMERYPLYPWPTIVEGTLTPIIDDPARLLADGTQK